MTAGTSSFFVLEGAQAGVELDDSTEEAGRVYRRAFQGFDPEKSGAIFRSTNREARIEY